jgi:hypothetical protein
MPIKRGDQEASFNPEPQQEIQLTCHSFGQKGLNEIVFNIDLKKKTMKLVGHGEEKYKITITIEPQA